MRLRPGLLCLAFATVLLVLLGTATARAVDTEQSSGNTQFSCDPASGICTCTGPAESPDCNMMKPNCCKIDDKGSVCKYCCAGGKCQCLYGKPACPHEDSGAAYWFDGDGNPLEAPLPGVLEQPEGRRSEAELNPAAETPRALIGGRIVGNSVEALPGYKFVDNGDGSASLVPAVDDATGVEGSFRCQCDCGNEKLDGCSGCPVKLRGPRLQCGTTCPEGQVCTLQTIIGGAQRPSGDLADIGIGIPSPQPGSPAPKQISETLAPSSAGDARFQENTNYPGRDFRDLATTSAGNCNRECSKDDRCQAWTYVKPGIQGPSGKCWLKDSVPRSKQSDCCTSGIRQERTTRDQGSAGARARAESSAGDARFQENTNYPGRDYRDLATTSAGNCNRECSKDDRCQAWTYVKPGIQGPSGKCWLKDSVPRAKQNDCCISGLRQDRTTRDQRR